MPSIILKCVCICCCSIFLYAILAMLPRDVQSEEFLTIKVPAVDNPVMPRVLFNHDKHVAFVEARDSDCARCHRITSKGFSVAVLDVRLQKDDDAQVKYLHAACTDCHKASGRGPVLAQCRSCHAKGNVFREIKK